MKIVIPSIVTIHAFADITRPMLFRNHANLHQSRTLATLRDTLLPKLQSGELRVGKVEKEAVI